RVHFMWVLWPNHARPVMVATGPAYSWLSAGSWTRSLGGGGRGMDVSVLTRARRGLGVVVILLVFHAVAWMAAHRIQGGKSPHLRQEVALIASLEGDGFLPGLLTVTRGVPVRNFATS